MAKSVGFTDGDVLEAIRGGAKTAGEVATKLGLASGKFVGSSIGRLLSRKAIVAGDGRTYAAA